jgi:hypothetical protein
VLDRTVSSSHLTLTLSGDTVSAHDHSKNGTFVNDRRVTEAPLQTGDRIRVGMTELQLLVPPVANDAPTVIAGPGDRTAPRQAVSHPAPVAAARRASKFGDTGPYKTAGQPQQPAKAPESRPAENAKRKRPPNKIRRLLLVGAPVLLVMVVAMWLSERKPTPPGHGRPPKDKVQPQADKQSVPVRQGLVVDVLTEFGHINLGAYPAEVKATLERGRDYYLDRGLPGRRYNACRAWCDVHSRLSGADAQLLANCISTVETELTKKFKDDSTDVEVRARQTPFDYVGLKRLLDGIVDEFPDPDDPRYAWAKQKLNKYDKSRKR